MGTALIGEACERVLGEPVVWGRNDCCLWVADILVAAGLPDPAAEYRGRYFTGRQALAFCGNLTGLAEKVAARLGWREVDPAEAPVLSVGLVATKHGPAAAICDGRFFVHRLDGGVEFLGPEFVIKSWRTECH